MMLKKPCGWEVAMTIPTAMLEMLKSRDRTSPPRAIIRDVSPRLYRCNVDFLLGVDNEMSP
jgi:hypothetical protein